MKKVIPEFLVHTIEFVFASAIYVTVRVYLVSLLDIIPEPLDIGDVIFLWGAVLVLGIIFLVWKTFEK